MLSASIPHFVCDIFNSGKLFCYHQISWIAAAHIFSIVFSVGNNTDHHDGLAGKSHSNFFDSESQKTIKNVKAALANHEGCRVWCIFSFVNYNL